MRSLISIDAFSAIDEKLSNVLDICKIPFSLEAIKLSWSDWVNAANSSLAILILEMML